MRWRGKRSAAQGSLEGGEDEEKIFLQGRKIQDLDHLSRDLSVCSHDLAKTGLVVQRGTLSCPRGGLMLVLIQIQIQGSVALAQTI